MWRLDAIRAPTQRAPHLLLSLGQLPGRWARPQREGRSALLSNRTAQPRGCQRQGPYRAVEQSSASLRGSLKRRRAASPDPRRGRTLAGSQGHLLGDLASLTRRLLSTLIGRDHPWGDIQGSGLGAPLDKPRRQRAMSIRLGLKEDMPLSGTEAHRNLVGISVVITIAVGVSPWLWSDRYRLKQYSLSPRVDMTFLVNTVGKRKLDANLIH